MLIRSCLSLPFGRFSVAYDVCEVVFRNGKIAYLLLWDYPIDGLKFAKLNLVDVKLPTDVEKLPTAVTNLDFFYRARKLLHRVSKLPPRVSKLFIKLFCRNIIKCDLVLKISLRGFQK